MGAAAQQICRGACMVSRGRGADVDLSRTWPGAEEVVGLWGSGCVREPVRTSLQQARCMCVKAPGIHSSTHARKWYYSTVTSKHVLELTAGLRVILIAPTLDLRDWGTLQAFGHPHEPLARWLVLRFGIPSHNYCTVMAAVLQVGVLLHCVAASSRGALPTTAGLKPTITTPQGAVPGRRVAADAALQCMLPAQTCIGLGRFWAHYIALVPAHGLAARKECDAVWGCMHGLAGQLV